MRAGEIKAIESKGRSCSAKAPDYVPILARNLVYSICISCCDEIVAAIILVDSIQMAKDS